MKNKIPFAILMIFLIAGSLLVLPLIKKYVGYVPVENQAGTITELLLEIKHPTVFWHGFYGIVLMVPSYNAQQSALAPGGKISQDHLIFNCLEPGKDHELYASTTQFPIWDSVIPATTEDIDNYLGINSSAWFSSAFYTFKTNITVELGPRILIVPGTYTKQAGVPNSTSFNLGVLKDSLGNLIFVTKVADYLPGYNTDVTNYQIMVPAKNGTIPRYYFFRDPYDKCPAGLEPGLIGGRGYVYGWVKDNTTSLFIDGVQVLVENNATLTNIHGFYNFTVPSGFHVIGATKSGYQNYLATVNVTLRKGTQHNITMVPAKDFETIYTGVGPGIGPGQDVGPGTSTGIGPSFETDVGPYTEEPTPTQGMDIWISTTHFNIVLRTGTFAQDIIKIYNFKTNPVNINFDVDGNASPSIKLNLQDMTILPKSMANITVTFFGNQPIGSYGGNIKLGGAVNYTMPVQLRIVAEDKLPIEALLVDVTPTKTRLYPGENLMYKVDLKNLLTDQEYDVYLKYSIKDLNNTKVFYRGEDKVHLKTSYSLLKNYQIPKNASLADYLVQVDAYYLNLVTTGTAIYSVVTPFYNYKIFGFIAFWQLLLILLAITLIVLGIMYLRKKLEEKKRFHVKVETDLLPQAGPRTILVGKLAETEKKVYFDMDNLTVHTIVAGSTGGGKTISAQVIIEECLMKNIAVIVFDPTAQWSGYLRKCTDKKMMTFYPKFNLKKTDARAFPGNIRYVENPYEIIDVKRYMHPGNIQVFAMNKLDPKDIDVFVANTVREVFHMNLAEARELKLLLVYDEVHRLLPKFGGSGEGFIQIERACREFRKWGVGVMLISQVLADFVGQIKANINTEIQMKTRDEGDLNRIETKFGKGLIQSLVKSPVGSGMVQNAAYNRGNPFFVEFRPILHSVERLTDDELARYNKYNNIIDDVEFQIDQLEEQKIDVFDLRLELKLAKDKLQTGNFNMVDIYLEGITPRITANFEKLGITPKKRELKLVDRTALEKELQAAKSSRAEYEKATKVDAPKEVAKTALKFEEDVPPDKILKLKNDMLVVNLKGLIDELAAMKPDHFTFHVNDNKHDFADWVQNVIGKKGLAARMRQEKDKQKLIAMLEDAFKKEKSGAPEEEEPKEVAKPESPKPEASKARTPLDDINITIKDLGAALEKKEFEPASKLYSALANAYKLLPPPDRATIAPVCIELKSRLDSLGRLTNLFSSDDEKVSQIKAMVLKARDEIARGQGQNAFEIYKEIMVLYQSLPVDAKKLVLASCQALHEALTVKVPT